MSAVSSFPRLASTLILVALATGRASAGEPGDDWGADFGTVPEARPEEPPGKWSGAFTLRWRAGVWLEKLDTTPLATLKTSLDGSVGYSRGPWRLSLSGHAEVDPAFMLQRDEYDAPTYDTYATLLDVRKSHIAYSGAQADVTLGYQIVPWGEGLMLGALDVTNPRDLREPGLADLEDMRLPVLSTRLGIGQGNQRLELFWVHEARFGYRSPPLGPHSLYRAFVPDDIETAIGDRDIVIRDHPARYGLDAQQAFVRWMYRGAGVDLGVYVANALDQRGVPGALDPLAAAQEQDVALPLLHERYWLMGTSGVIALTSVLLKWEIGAFPDRPLTLLGAGAEGAVNVRTMALDVFASVVWDMSPENQLALEWQQLFLPASEPRAEYLLHPEVPHLGVRFSHRGFSERLLLELLALVDVDLGGVLSAVLRGSVDYQVSDEWRVGVGGISYLPSPDRTGPLSAFDRNSQLFVRLRWDFGLN